MNNSTEITFGQNDLGANTLLILGNGFDLDLGLRTSYGDFVRSEFWPFKYRLCGLGGYLNRHKNDRWFDLERSMEQYCTNHPYREERTIKDERDDARLIESLRGFLQFAEEHIHKEKDYRTDSAAANLLRTICATTAPGKIYTFNYTNLRSIARDIINDAATGLTPIHIHGTLENNDIILGFTEKDCIPDCYGCFFKTRRNHYKATSLFQSLPKYGNIIFFGLSFGDIDSVYYRPFFEELTRGELGKKYIRIITKDEDSRQQIFTNLSSIIGTDISAYNNSDFKIITTDGSMQEALNEVYYHLSKDGSFDDL